MNERVRCSWVPKDELYEVYHDYEWGVPLHSDQGLFEFLILEGQQAGLNWLTILRKRENLWRAYAGFDAGKMAIFSEDKVNELMMDAGIIRNRQKIEAAITNAQGFLNLVERHGSFSNYIWQFSEGEPIVNTWSSFEQVPAKTPLSEKISRDLKENGFKFVGPTIIYAFMQAVGIVNDHLTTCFRHQECQIKVPH